MSIQKPLLHHPTSNVLQKCTNFEFRGFCIHLLETGFICPPPLGKRQHPHFLTNETTNLSRTFRPSLKSVIDDWATLLHAAFGENSGMLQIGAIRSDAQLQGGQNVRIVRIFYFVTLKLYGMYGLYGFFFKLYGAYGFFSWKYTGFLKFSLISANFS